MKYVKVFVVLYIALLLCACRKDAETIVHDTSAPSLNEPGRMDSA